jgi:hypothetical protein
MNKLYRSLARAIRALNMSMHQDPTRTLKIQTVDHPTRGWLYAIKEEEFNG